MVQICCVDGCNDKKEDVIYFKFPNSRTLRRKWLDAFTPLGKVTIDSVVCSQHFLEEQYELVRGKKRLKAKVIPSLFDVKKPKSPQTDKKTKNTTEQKDNDNTEEKVTTDKSKHQKKKTKTIDNVNMSRNGTTDRQNSIVTRTVPKLTNDTEAKDIEDIITNYQIKQIRPICSESETNNQSTTEQRDVTNQQTQGEREKEIASERDGQTRGRETADCGTESDANNIINIDNLKDTVFIEVTVDKGGGEQPNQDCMMLLESVQCEVDPSSLVFHEPDQELVVQDDNNSDVIDLGVKKEDPISLLTSSDEDEVIIQEPKIDTVEVSDETDEDDVPLVKLTEAEAQKRPTKSKKKKSTKSKKSNESINPTANNISNIMWGMYEYYCIECSFTTTNRSEYKNHKTQHTTVLQLCQTCGYTTASKAQFARHKRKHQDDKKFKCHLCDYKARHNMSLIYHLKSHDGVKLVSTKNGYRCEKCGFQSDVKTALLKHIRMCTTVSKKYSCGKCSYETKRRSDLKRHNIRRHQAGDSDDDDDDDYVPSP